MIIFSCYSHISEKAENDRLTECVSYMIHEYSLPVKVQGLEYKTFHVKINCVLEFSPGQTRRNTI